jgi:hypothetical protein
MYAKTQSALSNLSGAYEPTLEMAKIRLLIERGGLETERVDHVVDLDGTILDTLIGFFSRCIGSSVYIPSVLYLEVGLRDEVIRTDFDGTESDHGAVNFIDNAIDFLDIVGVGDDLVTGDDVLLSTRMLAGDPPHLVPTSSDEA